MGTQVNEDGLGSKNDEILGDESNTTTTETNETINHDNTGLVDEDDDERSSSDDEDEDDDEDDDDDEDGEDELDDDELDIVPSKSVITKTKGASNNGVGGSGVSSTTKGTCSSALSHSQHRKHHHRRVSKVSVAVKAGSSRGLGAGKCAAGIRSRKSIATCHSPVCVGVTSSDDEEDDDEVGDVDESLERESDEDDEDDEGLEPPDFLLPTDVDPLNTQGIPPDAQARLEAFFEAAGFTDGRLMSDPESLRKLTMTVSSALGEASAAINRMRDSQRYDDSSRRKSLDEGRSDSMEEGDSLLALACSSGYYELARVLLAMGANVDDRGSKGDLTPLMDAASQGHIEIVRLLINHGAEVNTQSACGNSPLMYACAAGHEDIVKELLKSGGNVEDNNENGHTPLMEAASAGHVGVAKILLEHGAGINTHSNEFKESALTVACYKGHLDMVKYLLAAGADQQHKTDEMHTALMEASMDGHVEVARLLLDSGAQVNMPADSFESPLTLACCGGHVMLAELLIERGAKIEEVNDEGYTPLMEAAREGHLAVVQCLLVNGASINSQTEETHETALTLAACGGFLDVVDMLLKSGADIELGASTPLMEAAQEGHLPVVKYLLDRNADINRQTQTGDTAFSYACENGHLDVAELLVEKGADPEHLSEGGRTPLMKACRGGHVEVLKFLLQKGANVNRQSTSNDHTPLSLACAGGHLACVDALLHAGANPFHKLKDNSTMLIEAARGGHASVMKVLLDFVPASHIKGHEKAVASGNAKGQVATPAGKAGNQNLKTNDPNRAGTNANQAKNSVSVLRKSRSTSTLEPTSTQPNKECVHSKVETATEEQVEPKQLPKAVKNQSTEAQSQKNKAPTPCNTDVAHKHANTPSSTTEKKGSATVVGFCPECISKESSEKPHGNEASSTGQTSVKRSVRTEPVLSSGVQAASSSIGTSTQTLPSGQTGPPLVPSQVTAATAISERPKAKANKPSARKQVQLQQQGNTSPGQSPGSDKGQLSPNGSPSSSSSGVSPQAVAYTSASGTHKTAHQLPNCVPSAATTSSGAVVQMQVQQVRSGVGVGPGYGNAQLKLDSKQLSHLFHQHQMMNKSKSTSFQTGAANDPNCSGAGVNATTTTTTTTVVVTHGNGETETIIEGDNLPPGANEMIMSAAASAFPLECFQMQSGLQLTPTSGVHVQSYQLSSPGAISVGVTPLTTTMQTTTIINSAAGIGSFQPPMLLPHPPPLPSAIAAAAAAAGVVPPSGAPPPGVLKGSNNMLPGKGKDSQKSNMNQMVKTLSGSMPNTAPVQQPQTPVPPVATVAGIQTTKKQLAKRTRPFGNSSGGNQSRQNQSHGNSHGHKQNQAVASTQTTLSGQAADKILKHLDLDCATESSGETGLSVAASSGHYEVVEFLLSRKAHIEHRDKKGCTPLILAADGGHDKIVELLIAHGAEIEAQSDRTKDTALSLACTKGRYEVVEHLLKKGANKEHRNVSDYTPLSLAASGGYVNIIKLLLNHGAEINSRTGSKLGISPLMLAAMNGNTAAVKLLLDMGSDINAQIETNKNTALTLACFQGRQEVVSLLLDRKANHEHRAKTGLTPLMEAANGGYTEVGKILLDRGADVNAAPVPATKDTALTIAADKGHFRFVELLLQRGAIVEVRNKKGCTPLWLACHGGHSDVAQILFKHGADLDAQDNRRVSCLMAGFRKGHVKVIRWIVKNVQQFPSDGEMIRFYASIQSEPDLLKKCQQCGEFIKQAKDKQALEANKNASILLEELDMERSREESKRQAAARRREKKKKKKQEKKQIPGSAKDDDDDDNEEDEQDAFPDEVEEDNVAVADSGIDANSLGSNSSSTGTDVRGARKNNKENLQKPKQNQPDQTPSDAVGQSQQAVATNSKTKKKKNKKDKQVPPPVVETPTLEPLRKASSRDVLRESENRILEEKEKAPVKAKDDKRNKKVVETYEMNDESNKTSHFKDTNVKTTKKASKALSEPPSAASNTGAASQHHHPEPLMGISLNPSNMRKNAPTNNEQDSNSSHSQYHVSPANVKATPTPQSSVVSQVGVAKSGRKDDGWKEVTRSCPSSRSKKVMVPSTVISRVIGRAGCNINAIREATGAHIEVEKQQKGQPQPERTIQIKGSVESTKQAHTLITALMNEPDLDVKKLLMPVVSQSTTTSVWSGATYTATTVNSGQRSQNTYLSGSTPASAPVEIQQYVASSGSYGGKKNVSTKPVTSPVNLPASPPNKKLLASSNGSNSSVQTKISPSSAGKRLPSLTSGSNMISSNANTSTSCTSSFASKVVPQQHLPASGNLSKENQTNQAVPAKTATPTFPVESPAPSPTTSSPLSVSATNGVSGQMKSPIISTPNSNQAFGTSNLTQFAPRSKEEPIVESQMVQKAYTCQMPQDHSMVPTSTQPLSAGSENGGNLNTFGSLSARSDTVSDDITRIERPLPQGALPLEYSPFNYQFSKTSSSGWYQDDFNQVSSSLTSALGSQGNMMQQQASNLGPVGTLPNLLLSSSAARAMNFASVAASGISSNMSTTSAQMSQTGGAQNGNGQLNSLGLASMTLGSGKPLGDVFVDSDVPKVDASPNKAPGYRGNNMGSPLHRMQQQQQHSGAPLNNFSNENLSLPQFAGPHTGIIPQGSQIGFPNMGRQLNQSLNNQPQSYNSNAVGIGMGIQQDFIPRNVSPQSSSALNFTNSGGLPVAPSQPRPVISSIGVATNVVLSSRLNPRAPSFSLSHTKMSPVVQPPSQQFSSMHQQQPHNAFKLSGHMNQYGNRSNTGLSNSGRQVNIGGNINMNLGQGWNSYPADGSSNDFQGIPPMGAQQTIDQPILSGLESPYEPGTLKLEDRRVQRTIGPIGAERSMKASGGGGTTTAMPFSLPPDCVDSGPLGLQQQQQNQPLHLHQQQASSWGGMYGSSNPQLYPGSNQHHHQPLQQLGSVTSSHASQLSRGNGDVRPFTGNRFLEQMDPNRYLDYHHQMYDGQQRLLNGGGMPPSMVHMQGNAQPNVYPFGIDHSDQQQHIPKVEHLQHVNSSWGDSHLVDDKQTMNWGKWGN